MKKFLLFIFMLCAIVALANVRHDSTDDKVSDDAIKNKISSLIKPANDNENNPQRTIDNGLQALELAKKINDTISIVNAQNIIGKGYSDLDNFESAKKYFDDALQNAKLSGNKKGLAFTLMNYAMLNNSLGDYEKAREQINTAFDLSKTLAVPELTADIKFKQGIINYSDKKFDSALDDFNNALLLYQSLNERKNEARTLNYIANIYGLQGKTDNAVLQYKKAIEIQSDINDKQGMAKTFDNIAKLFQKIDDKNNALMFYFNELRVLDELNDSETIAYTLNNIGLIYLDLNSVDNAYNSFEKSNQLISKSGLKSLKAQVKFNLGTTFYRKNKGIEAIDAFTEALKIFEEIKNQIQIDNCNKMIAASYILIGNNLHSIQNYSAARDNFVKALNIYKLQNDSLKTASTIGKIASSFSNEGKYDDAELLYSESSNRFSQISGNTEACTEYIKLLNSYAGLMVKLDNYAQAEQNYNKALDISKSCLKDKDSNYIMTLTNLASLYRASGRYKEADQKMSEARELSKKIFGEDDLHFVGFLMEAKAEAIRKNREATLALQKKKAELSILGKDKAIDSLSKVKEIDSLNNKRKILEQDKLIIDTKVVVLEKDKQYKSLTITFLIVGSIFLLILAIVLFYRYSENKKYNKLLKEKNTKIELFNTELSEKNKIITDQNIELDTLINDLTLKNHQIEHANSELELQNELVLNQKEELNIANATKDKFFSIIAHDLKNPIHGLMFSTDLILNYYQKLSEKELLSYIDNINKLSNGLSNLLENLLQWSRTQSGAIDFEPEDYNINDIVNENITLLAQNAENKNITVTADLADNSNAKIDKNMITTVIRNLLTNSIKFTPERGSVKISTKLQNNNIEFSIADNGVGISDEDISKLFRIDVHHTSVGTAKEKGTGLGLILCKEFIEKHGGKIWVESQLGKGSTFIFTVPVKI